MLKSPIILLSLVCIISCGVSAATKCRDFADASFALKITLTERETSKDSHWISESVHIADRYACYGRTSGGFLAGNDKSGSCRLDDATFERIRKQLLEHGPHRDIHESKSTAGLGRSVSLHMEVFLDGKKTVAKISGMLNAWEKRDIGKVSNIENIGLVHHAGSIINMVKSSIK
ncbi:MAG TPA: hypothetical protein PKY31_05590 [Spirochaetota bacterium]|nr:hypothetical protein [Spirochaetota bacterium]